MQKAAKKRLFIIGLVILLVFASAFGLALASGPRTVIAHLLRADAIWLLLIFGAQSFAYWSYVIPYKFIFDIGYRDAFKHSFEGFHPFRPGGGMSYDISHNNTNKGRARVAYLSFWEYAALAPAILIAAVYAYLYRLVPSAIALPWIVGVPAGALLFFLVMAFRQKLYHHPKIRQAINSIHFLLKSENVSHSILLLFSMVMYWLGELFALYGALKLFNIDLGWFAMLLAYASGYLVTRRSLPLGGAGVILLSLSLALHVVGLSLSVALLTALTYQITNLIIPLAYRRILPVEALPIVK